ncbi:hypothetical protein CLAIMM_06147 [Cladophialophora immunda]|nr:hypothetical protein CLAIMM_06147 [Cladophialophora immunda]
MPRRSPIPWIDRDSNLRWYDPDGGHRRRYEDDQGTSYKKTPNSKGHSRALSAVFAGVHPPRTSDRAYRNSGRSCINIEGPFYDEDFDRWDYYDISRPGRPRRLDYCRHGEVEVACLYCNGSYGHGHGYGRGGRGRSPSRGPSRSRSRSRDRRRRRRHRHGRDRDRWPHDGDEIIACYTGDLDYDFGPPRRSSSRHGRRRPRPGRSWAPDREWGFGHGGCGLEPMYDFDLDVDFDFEHDFDYDYDHDFDYGYDYDYNHDYDYEDGRRRRGRDRRGSRRDRDRDVRAADASGAKWTGWNCGPTTLSAGCGGSTAAERNPMPS